MQLATWTRWLDCLDLFSGEGSFHNICRDAGKTVASVDKLADEVNQNILTKPGFFAILGLVCALDP